LKDLIREKQPKIVSARYRGSEGEREGGGEVREGVGAVGRNDPSIVCTYE
jgi:hypothetical protein